MPELPEVETVRRVLKSHLIGKTIINVESNYEKMVLDSFSNFKKTLIGQTFKDIRRMGKYLLFFLNDYVLISHLRMEGKFFYEDNDFLINKHIHMIISLDDNHRLYYQDTRKFGIMLTKPIDDYMSYEGISKLALDANDTKFLPEMLFNKLKSSNLPIKELLLNQEIIAGLGNIYVDEVLFKSKLNPLKKGKEINIDICKDILNNSKEVLDKAIIYKGTTIRSYTSSLNVKGQYQDFLMVHTIDKCKICNSNIEIIKVGGRSTYYCPKCQK